MRFLFFIDLRHKCKIYQKHLKKPGLWLGYWPNDPLFEFW